MKKFFTKRRNIILVIVLAILIVPVTFSFSRYIFNKISENYYTSKKFFFNSSMLNGRTYKMYNYNGIGDYTFKIDVTNSKDSLNYTNYDINYNVILTCKKGSTNIPCSYIDSNNGKLTTSSSPVTNYILITVNSNGIVLVNGDQIEIDISVTSTTNYSKRLTSKFILVVNEESVNYSITDSANSLYLDLLITNNQEDKAITINFDETLLQLDLSNVFARSATKTTDDHGRTDSLSMTISKGQTYSIRFYKLNPTQSYNLNSEVITIS